MRTLTWTIFSAVLLAIAPEAVRAEPVAIAIAPTIGGTQQHVLVRGADASLPPLILLHGGPGVSETALFRAFVPSLEEHFLVVYWDQRGAGRSFRRDIPPDSMSVERFVSDLGELLQFIADRFGPRRAFLLGHSWGTVIGTIYAHRHPEGIAAYIGVGQVADYPRAERLSWSWALAQAEAREHERASRELRRIGPPPHDVDEMLESRRWVEQFGGSFHPDLSTGGLIWAALTRGGGTLRDLFLFGRGNRFSLEALWPELRSLDLTELRDFDVPVFFLLGRYDMQVPAEVAADQFETLVAPCKRLFWFEAAAHNVPFESPDEFLDVVARRIPALLDSEECAATPGEHAHD